MIGMAIRYTEDEGVGIAWSPTSVRLYGLDRLGNSVQLAEVPNHHRETEYEYWMGLRFVQDFPAVSSWATGNGWAGDVAVEFPKQSAGNAFRQSMITWLADGTFYYGRVYYGGSKHHSATWGIECRPSTPDDPTLVMIAVPDMLGATNSTNWLLQIAMARLLMLGVYVPMRQLVVDNEGRDAIVASFEHREPLRFSVQSHVPRSEFDRALPIDSRSLYVMGYDNTPLHFSFPVRIGQSTPIITNPRHEWVRSLGID